MYVDLDLDLPALQALADRTSPVAVAVASFGGWGPWVEGGAWLTIDDTAVDWILRDVDRVAAQVARAAAASSPSTRARLPVGPRLAAACASTSALLDSCA